jgi:2,5-diamino-6-(ribosylamino)-4(3H)-pyrimidinone 5'-phosphate reductase
MRSSLEALNARYSVKVVRVNSGGTVNSVLIHPFLFGGKPDPTIFDPLKAGIPDLRIPLKPYHSEVLEHGIIWARHTLL